MRNHGQNMAKLILMLASRNAIPTGGCFADGVKFFTDTEHRMRVLQQAERDADTAIQAIKTASDNPYGDDSEVIAGLLIERIQEKLDAKMPWAGGEK